MTEAGQHTDHYLERESDVGAYRSRGLNLPFREEEFRRRKLVNLQRDLRMIKSIFQPCQRS